MWEVGIPGKANVRISLRSPQTPWEGGTYKLKMYFPEEYPSKPPKCTPPHHATDRQASSRRPCSTPTYSPRAPCVCPSWVRCAPATHADEEKSWKPAITIKQILLGVQDLLNDPNPGDPAQADAFHLFKQDRAAYERRVRQIAREMQAQGQLA